MGSGPETEEEREETLEERCKRLERELARQKLKAEIEEQGAAEHFWFSGGNPFPMLFRQSARNALGLGCLAAGLALLCSYRRPFTTARYCGNIVL